MPGRPLVALISSSGALLLKETSRVTGLGRGLSGALSPWRPARTSHDPGKVLLDVATAVALGGDCFADVAALRAQPELFGTVASDPTASRVFAALAADDRCRGGRDPGCACRCSGRVVGTTASAGRRAGQTDRWAGDHRHRRHAGECALGQGGRRADLQARVRVRPDVHVR